MDSDGRAGATRDDEADSALLSLHQAQEEHPIETKQALADELKQLVSMGAIRPVTKAKLTAEQRNNIIPSQVVMQYKRDPVSDALLKVKARVVANGNRQKPESYGEISSTTAETTSVFLIIALAAANGWFMSTMDVRGAYLQAGLEDKKIVIRLPRAPTAVLVELYPGYGGLTEFDGTMYLELHRALYGLKQSGYQWNQLLTSVMLANGFRVSSLDKSVFYKAGMVCGVHVDDIICIHAYPQAGRQLHEALVRRFPEGVVFHEGLEHAYLGLKVVSNHDRKKYLVSQPAFASNVAAASGLSDLANTPATENLFDLDESEPTDAFDYTSRAASLLYLSTRTRPDIRLATGVLMQRAHGPNKYDLARLERTEAYVRSTQGHCLMIAPTTTKLAAWVDASYGVHADMRSHSGTILTLGGAVVYAASNKQRLMATSSTQAELASLASAIDKITWARSWLEELGYKQGPVTVWQDNQSTMRMAERGFGKSSASKHWAMRYFYAKEAIDLGTITLQYVSTENMLADALTKPIPRDRFAQWRTSIGVIDPPVAPALSANLQAPPQGHVGGKHDKAGGGKCEMGSRT
jgi:hypothetical protein